MKRILFFLFLSVFSCTLIAQSGPSKKCPICGVSMAQCKYKGRHSCSTCGKLLTDCQYGGHHPKPKCSTCGKLLTDCQYGGEHPKCSTCGKLLTDCQYGGEHPKCSTCGKLLTDCQYGGEHPKCFTCGKLLTNCQYGGEHPKCSTCGKLLTDCRYNGNHFGTDGTTTHEYTDNVIGLTFLTNAIKEYKSCRHGAITENMGVIIKGDNGYACTGINSSLAEKIKEINQRKEKVLSVTMTNSGYFCIIYGINGWYAYVPEEMLAEMKKYQSNGETICCVSICENGAFAIVTDKHFFASNSTDYSIMKKAKEKYGQIKDVCITNKGITVICDGGVFYRNVPIKVEEKIKQCKERPDHIRFTDSGTCLITYESGKNYQYYM